MTFALVRGQRSIVVLSAVAPPAPPPPAPAGGAPTITGIANVVIAHGDVASYPVRVDYLDDDCDVVAGTWLDQLGTTHDFGNAGVTDAAHPGACSGGVGYLTPGYAVCASPSGVPGSPGQYPRTITLRDALGRVSAPYTFYVICQ